MAPALWSRSNPADSLAMLREYLKHFHESGHFVDSARETEIKIIMLRRIAKLEATLQRTSDSQNL